MLFPLQKRQDFLRVKQYGKKMVTPYFIAQWVVSQHLEKQNEKVQLSPDLLFAPSPIVPVQAKADEIKGGKIRVGYIVTKKIGCSVDRHRAKRRLREALRLSIGTMNYNHLSMIELVLIARHGALTCPFEVLKSSIVQTLNRFCVPLKNNVAKR